MKNLDQVTDDFCCMLDENKSEYQSLLASGTWSAKDEAESIYDADQHDFTIEQLEESIARLFKHFESESNPSQVANMNEAIFNYLTENTQYATEHIDHTMTAESFASLMWDYYVESLFLQERSDRFIKDIFLACCKSYFAGEHNTEYFRADIWYKDNSGSEFKFFTSQKEAVEYCQTWAEPSQTYTVSQFFGVSCNMFGWSHSQECNQIISEVKS